MRRTFWQSRSGAQLEAENKEQKIKGAAALFEAQLKPKYRELVDLADLAFAVSETRQFIPNFR